MRRTAMPRTRMAHASLAAALLGIAACAGTPNTPLATKTSRFHANNVPNGSLRVAEVIHTATREEIKNGGWGYDVLIAAGIPDEKIRDGSAVVARVQCCGGPNEEATILLAYVPDGRTAAAGDIVEIWSGTMVMQDDALGAMPNTLTRVREKAQASTKACRWMPDDPTLWVRVIYCDWMPGEGWTQQSGLFPYWIKPIGAASPPLS